VTIWNTINGLDLLAWVVAGTFAYFWWTNRKSAMRQEIEWLQCDLKMLQVRCEVVKSALTQAVRERDAAQDQVKTILACVRVGGGGLAAIQRMLKKSDLANERLDSLEARLRRGVI